MDEKQVCRKRTLNTTNSSSTRYGVFPETGFPNDPIYPTLYLKGEQALKNLGCPSFLFCPRSMVGSLAPTKQNQLCRGATALEVIKSKAGLRRGVYNLPQEGKLSQELTFKYVEAAPPSFVLVLDQSGQMGRVRWASVKKALYRWVLVRLSRFRKIICLSRFIGLLPEGATLAIVAYGETASLVLPPTTVTEEKREGLHGRVPRRVLEQTLRLLCLECICICEFVFLLIFVYLYLKANSQVTLPRVWSAPCEQDIAKGRREHCARDQRGSTRVKPSPSGQDRHSKQHPTLHPRLPGL